MALRDQAALRQALSAAIAGLSAGESLTVLELTAAGLTAFEVSRDELDVPLMTANPPLAWGSAGADASAPDGPLVLVNSAPRSSRAAAALDRLGTARPDAPVVRGNGLSAQPLLEEAVADSPIRQHYDLLVARPDPGDGRIRLASERLFAEGTVRGATTSLSVRTDGEPDKTVLAVVAWRGRTPFLLSADAVSLPPGRHQVRAELRGPGRVRFTEPAHAENDPRSLAEIMAAVPSSLNSFSRAHLICAIEIAGPAPEVAKRLYLAEDAIQAIRGQLAQPRELLVGLIGYGAHRFDPGRDDHVIVLGWKSTPEEALGNLGRLGAAELGYPHAAQVEDMLGEVVRRLGRRPPAQPTALLVVGDRPPHPADADGAIRLCPRKHNWTRLRDQLRRSKVSITVIRDKESAPGLMTWADLSSGPVLSRRTIDTETLGHRAGLARPTTRHIPLPMICADEGTPSRPGLH